MVWLLGRIQVDGPEDVPAVRAVHCLGITPTRWSPAACWSHPAPRG
ncbi:hypothetical protein [Nocardia farcinica]|nr:hypothetical protein [Nocardia farcinica]